ncbi:hypothetical protein ACIOD2_37685 [Amycolatopsis sp. NPDC088138]|uniref:hypothetical protein n=1 Tax=Amycolatopsis sp. NPDC088138 TaxID=3363938 RepID=UPI0038111AD4
MADQIMTRFGALDRELAEAVLHTMILVARDGVQALDDVHRRLEHTLVPDEPALPGERWQLLLGELFRIRVRYSDLAAAVAGRPPDVAGDERSAQVVGRLVGAAGAFLTAESLGFEERLERLVPPAFRDAIEPEGMDLETVRLRLLLDQASTTADEVLDHAGPQGWLSLIERYLVPAQSRADSLPLGEIDVPVPPQPPIPHARVEFPVMVLADHVGLGDVALTVHRQILKVRERYQDLDLDVRFRSPQHLREVLDAARDRAWGELDARIRFRCAADGEPPEPPGAPYHPVAVQFRQLMQDDRPPRPGHLIIITDWAGVVPDATQVDQQLAVLDLDAQGLLPDLGDWTVTCIGPGPGVSNDWRTGYLRALCLAGGARSFDYVNGAPLRLPQPGRSRDRATPVTHAPRELRGLLGKRFARPLRRVTAAPDQEPPPPPGNLVTPGRIQVLDTRIRQLRQQSAQVLESHVVGPHGQNLTVREAHARADLLDGRIEMDQARGSLRHRRVSRLTRALVLLTVTLLDLPIMLWLTMSSIGGALDVPAWLAGAAGTLVALLTTGGAAAGLHQLGRNQRQYKNFRRQLVWTNMPATTKGVLCGVSVLTASFGTIASAGLYTGLARSGPAAAGGLIAGLAGAALIGSAAFVFWAAFRDGSLEHDDLRHYSGCARPLLVQKAQYDREEYELRCEFQRLAETGERSGHPETSLDDLRRQAGDPTDAQLMDRSLDENGASPVLLAYAEQCRRTDRGQQLLTMVRDASVQAVQNVLAEHHRSRASGRRKMLPAPDGQVTAHSE